jgi:hypothetical protein
MARNISNDEARQIMLASGFKPLVPYVKSSSPWLSICLKCKKEVSPSLNNVKSKGVTCQYCSGNAVHIDDVMKIMKMAKLNPLEEFPGAKQPWKCKCLICKNSISPTFSSVKRGGGCRYCARKIVGDKARTSESVAIEIMKKAGFLPLEKFVSSGAPWKSKCLTCNKVVSPRLAMIKNKGSGCAYCSGVKVDPVDAIKLFRKSRLEPLVEYPGNKIPWKSIHVPCGRQVSPSYLAIKRGQGPCKYCARVSVHPNDAKRLFLANDLKPLEPYSGDSKKPWKSIHIPCGREVAPTYNIIQRQESIGCRFCSDQFVDPAEAYELFVSKGFQPQGPYPGSSKPWKSLHVICGQVVQPRYGHIKAGRKGCPVCAGVVPITQERAFSFFRKSDLEPLEPFKGPHHPWKSIHTVCGKKVSPRWASVQQGNSGCVYCSGRKVDLREVKKLLKSLDLIPLVPYPGGHVPWRCIHTPCGSEVTPRYNAISRGQGPCQNCGKNMVSEDEAYQLLKKNRYVAVADFPGGSKPWAVEHIPCGSKISILATYLRAGGKGCSFCAGTKPITEKQALTQMKLRGFRPLEPFVNARSPLKAVHTVCGNELKVSWSYIKSGGNCRYCVGWRNLLAPAYLYLISNKELNAHKIGVSSFDASDNRVERHVKNGWEKFAILDLPNGDEAYELEGKILDWLRNDLMLPIYLVPELMPQGGYTETVDATEIDVEEIWAKVKELSGYRA